MRWVCAWPHRNVCVHVCAPGGVDDPVQGACTLEGGAEWVQVEASIYVGSDP